MRRKRKHLPQDRLSLTRRLWIKTGRSTSKYQITIGYYDDGTIGEVFVRCSGRDKPWADALSQVISVALQHGTPWEEISKRLRYQGFQPAGPATDEEGWQTKARSPADLIAQWVDDHQEIKP